MSFQGEFQLAVEKLKVRSKALDNLIEWLQAGPVEEGVPEQWILDKIEEFLGGTDTSLCKSFSVLTMTRNSQTCLIFIGEGFMFR